MHFSLRIYITFIVLFLWVYLGFSQQEIKFDHISDKYKFSSNVIRAITQDQQGFIWICTEDGLERFDGYESISFKHHPEDSMSISSGWTFSVYEDRDGQMWIGTKRGLNLLRRETGSFQRFMKYRVGSSIVELDDINKIYQDRAGKLWLGGKTLHCLNLENMSFRQYPIFDSIPYEAQQINFINEDKEGRILVGTYVGLFVLDREKDLFKPIVLSEINSRQKSGGFRGILKDSQENIWILGDSDLLKLDLSSQLLDTIAKNIIIQTDYVVLRTLVEDLNGGIWFGKTSSGLKRIDIKTHQITSFVHDSSNPNSIKDGIGEWLLVDQQGNLWIGGENGIDRLSNRYVNSLKNPSQTTQFMHYQVSMNGEFSDNSKMVRTFLKDKNGHFWVGTYEGLFQYQQEGAKMILLRYFASDAQDAHKLSSSIVRDILEDKKGNIWVATRSGLNKINSSTWETEHILFDSLSDKLADEVFWSLCEDSQGNIWVGTQENGLLKYDSENKKIKRFMHDPNDHSSISGNEVLDVFYDSQGHIWVGTLGGGLNLYLPERGSFLCEMPNISDPVSISSDIIWSIFEDSERRIWIGTQNGLNELLLKNKGGKIDCEFRKYLEEDGLINNTVHGILEDDLGRLWVSTIMGISCFSPRENTFLNFGLEDGLEAKNFNPHAYLKDPQTGELYFGGINGYNRFNPQYLQADSFAPAVRISSSIHFNSSAINGKPSIDILAAKEEILTFSYMDDIIIFDVTLMNFNATEKNQYKYMLVGINANWIPLGTTRKITFTNLDIGDYTLRIIGANQDGVWSQEETIVHFVVTPPWWWTSFAKLIYIFTFLLTVIAIYRYLLNRKLLEKEAQQLKEMNELKSHFFTNISHEFRTPLTIISGMANQMKEEPERWMEKGLELIHRNSVQLLSLINQILDLRKLELGKLQPNFINGNIIPYLQYILESFWSMAHDKNVRMHFLSSVSDITMDYDSEKMTQIFSNLLSNAIKYSNRSGDVYLHVDHYGLNGKSYLKAEVKDTGKGISKKALPYIFDRFYQVDRLVVQKSLGSGIGLSLTQELVKVLGGTIEVSSREGHGTTFTLILPITQQAKNQEQLFTSGGLQSHIFKPKNISYPKTHETKTDLQALASNLPLILIVEDNLDVQIYLSSCLESEYKLLFAENGLAGIEVAFEHIPDIIISDVMMPMKDGLELCDTLKHDTRTSHIPIILLTAKADFETKISGLKKGADAYLTKPFVQEELSVRIEQLLFLRRNLQKRYLGMTQIQTDNSSLPPLPAHEMEDEFIGRLREIILEHLSEEDFNIQNLCMAIGLGRTQLHKKLKALTGQSTSAFIRSIRLQKAQELLVNTDLTVAEVGYEVGISNPQYFSRIYKERFGQSPTKHVKSEQ